MLYETFGYVHMSRSPIILTDLIILLLMICVGVVACFARSSVLDTNRQSEWFIMRYLDVIPLNRALKRASRYGYSVILDSIFERELLWCSAEHIAIVCRQLALRGIDYNNYLEPLSSSSYDGIDKVIVSDSKLHCLKKGVGQDIDVSIDLYATHDILSYVLGNGQWEIFREFSGRETPDHFHQTVVGYVLSQNRFDLLESTCDGVRVKDLPEWMNDIIPAGIVSLDGVLEYCDITKIKHIIALRELGVTITLEDVEDMTYHFGVNVNHIPIFEYLKEDGKEYPYPIADIESNENILILSDFMEGLVYLREYCLRRNTQYSIKWIQRAFKEIVPRVQPSASIRCSTFYPSMVRYRPYVIRKTIEWYPSLLSPKMRKKLADVFIHWEDEHMIKWLEQQ